MNQPSIYGHVLELLFPNCTRTMYGSDAISPSPSVYFDLSAVGLAVLSIRGDVAETLLRDFPLTLEGSVYSSTLNNQRFRQRITSPKLDNLYANSVHASTSYLAACTIPNLMDSHCES